MKKSKNEPANTTYINTLLEQANAGDSAAASRLGDAYREGELVEQSWEQAFRWYSAAARAGDMEAQNNLGTLYLEGLHCPENFEKAVYWYRKSAEKGSDVAQYNLGMRYIHGQGVPVDNAQAMTWLKKSVDQGYYIAFFDLGLMYLYGDGCKPDRTKALRLAMQGAAGGDKRAVEFLVGKVPELEELAFEGDIQDCLMLSDLFFDYFDLPGARAHGWSWLLWADAKNSASQETFSAELYCRLHEIMSDKDKRGGIPMGDKKKGEKQFKAMQHEQTNCLSVKPEAAITPAVCNRASKPFRLPEKWREACAPHALIEKRFSKSHPEYELILDMAAEGGGVDLYGKSDGQGNWTFWSDMNDWTPTLLDEDAISRTTSMVTSWDAAIAVLDSNFPYWVNLYPCYVHPDFRKPMLELIERRQLIQHLVNRNGEKNNV